MSIQKRFACILMGFILMSGCSAVQGVSSTPDVSLSVSGLQTSHEESSLAVSTSVASSLQTSSITSSQAASKKQTTTSKPVKTSITAVSGGLSPAEVEKLRAEAAARQEELYALRRAYTNQKNALEKDIEQCRMYLKNYTYNQTVSSQALKEKYEKQIQEDQAKIAALTAEFLPKEAELQAQLDRMNAILKEYPVGDVVSAPAPSEVQSPTSSLTYEEELAQKRIQLVNLKKEYEVNKKIKEDEIINHQRMVDSQKREGNTSWATIYENTLVEMKKELERLIAAYEGMIRDLEIEITELEILIKNNITRQ